MATNATNRTVRSVADHVRHVLFPSGPAMAVAMAIEVGALLAGVPLAAHVAIAVATHAAMVALATVQRGRRSRRP